MAVTPTIPPVGSIWFHPSLGRGEIVPEHVEGWVTIHYDGGASVTYVSTWAFFAELHVPGEGLTTYTEALAVSLLLAPKTRGRP